MKILSLMIIVFLCSANVYAMDFYGRTFCRPIDNIITVEGWRIQADGLVDHIHPFAGMPDPSTYLQVGQVDTNGFYVGIYKKSDGTFLQNLHRFQFSKDGSYLIQDHWRLNRYYSEADCK